MSIIYKITNTVNDKVYIGQTIQTLKKRMHGHKGSVGRSTRHLSNAFVKYGWDAFVFEELEVCSTELLDDREIYYIKLYDSMDQSKGYNMTAGGNANRVHSAEVRMKISEGNKGKKASQETRDHMSQLMKGRVFTDEWKQKIREAKSFVSEETRAKLSAANKGRKHTETARFNMSEGQKKYTYTITDNNGIVTTTDNLTQYCNKNYNTSTLGMWRQAIKNDKRISKGKYKGWIIKKHAISAED